MDKTNIPRTFNHVQHRVMEIIQGHMHVLIPKKDGRVRIKHFTICFVL